MKKLVEVVATEVQDVEDEGMMALLGQVITVFCVRYIYTGKLIGVNKSSILLEDPKIVYETGSFSTKEWKDAQSLPNRNFYIATQSIESFGIMK